MYYSYLMRVYSKYCSHKFSVHCGPWQGGQLDQNCIALPTWHVPCKSFGEGLYMCCFALLWDASVITCYWREAFNNFQSITCNHVFFRYKQKVRIERLIIFQKEFGYRFALMICSLQHLDELMTVLESVVEKHADDEVLQNVAEVMAYLSTNVAVNLICWYRKHRNCSVAV